LGKWAQGETDDQEPGGPAKEPVEHARITIRQRLDHEAIQPGWSLLRKQKLCVFPFSDSVRVVGVILQSSFGQKREGIQGMIPTAFGSFSRNAQRLGVSIRRPKFFGSLKGVQKKSKKV
jgi:hypothetical protein